MSASINAAKRHYELDQALQEALQREKKLSFAARNHHEESGVINMRNTRSEALSQISAGLIKKMAATDSENNKIWELFELVSR